MSDLTDLFENKISPNDFVKKEFANFSHLLQAAGPEVQQAAAVVMDDAAVVLKAGASWAGTALSAYILANSDGLKSEVVKLVGAVMGPMGGPAGVATTDLVDAVSKLLLSIVQQEVLAATNVKLPPAG